MSTKKKGVIKEGEVQLSSFDCSLNSAVCAVPHLVKSPQKHLKIYEVRVCERCGARYHFKRTGSK